MTKPKKIPKKLKQKVRRRLLQIIDETSPEELFSKNVPGAGFRIKDGNGSYCVFQQADIKNNKVYTEKRWCFEDKEITIVEVDSTPYNKIIRKVSPVDKRTVEESQRRLERANIEGVGISYDSWLYKNRQTSYTGGSGKEWLPSFFEG